MSRLFSGLNSNFARGLIALTTGAVLFDQFCLYTVPAGHRGVVFNLYSGVDLESKKEGLHFRIPILHRISFLDTRITPNSITTTTGTKDMQVVNVSVRVLYNAMPEKAAIVLRDYNADYAQRILPSVCNEVLKSIMAKFDAEELLTKREQVARQVEKQLRLRCKNFHIALQDVSLTHLTFSTEFAKAIEDKQIQEQRAERAKYVVARAEQEKLAAIIASEGDAESAQLVSDAIKKYGRGILEIRRIETALDLAEKLSKTDNITYLPSSNTSNNNILLNLPTKR